LAGAIARIKPFGYIDAHGQYVIAPRFKNAQAFVNGIARVEQSSGPNGLTQFGYIDRHGAYVWGPFRSP